ncbi:hypothetical protein BT69DRAFT_1332102 [Atractiella rhizophila]|nr:hypothetical protein BT69DRAFT_1332102 [Atractiella rhizophila]
MPTTPTTNPKLKSYYIPSQHLPNLKQYKYSGADHSLISRYLLSPFWNRFVTLFPKRVAPNVITLTGLSFVIINFISLLYYNPSLNCVPKPLHVSQGGTWDPLFPPPEALASAPVAQATSWFTSFVSKLYPSKTPPPAVIGTIGGEGCRSTSGWLYASWALGLFLYQTFDAVDGKQARRTGTGGPLGEMFDHGCDALNTTLEVILTASALNLGMSWWTIASQAATLANFYLTTWEEYHTGTLYLSAFSGPVEGILIIIGIYIVTAFKGPGFWDHGILSVTGLSSLPILQKGGRLYPYAKDLPLNDCFLLFGGAGLCFNILTSYTNVLRSIRMKLKAQPTQNGKPKFVGIAKALKPLLGLAPFAGQSAIVYFWLHEQPVILRRNIIPFQLFWGLTFAYQVGLLITSHTTKLPNFPWFNLLTVWSAAMCLDANVAKIGKLVGLNITGLLHDGGQRSIWTVYASLALAAATYAFFVYDVVGVICAYLDINCLTIKHYKPDPNEKSLLKSISSALSSGLSRTPPVPPSKPTNPPPTESYAAVTATSSATSSNLPATQDTDDDSVKEGGRRRRMKWGRK